MELPQARPFGTQGVTQTHDFLSLCSPVQQDPRPPQGGFLKTHDFLQPFERVGKNVDKGEANVEVTTIEKPPPPAPPPSSVENLLPGGIGTYSISYINEIPKPDVSIFKMAHASNVDGHDDSLDCSYTGSGFPLWEESSIKKGKTGKENVVVDGHVIREVGIKIGGQWLSSEQQSQPFSKNDHHSNTFSSLSSSQPSSAQKNQGFIDMIRYAKSGQEEDDDDDDGNEFSIKRESSPYPRSSRTVKVDSQNTDQKANTPRSKHSATEQRRRSKINDRFQTLRRLIPNSDQKRDKASFLLEVIDYIQYLQKKVQKYEGSYQDWNQEVPKFPPNRNSNKPAKFRGPSGGSGPVLMFPVKFESQTENPNLPTIRQNPAGSDTSTATTLKAIDQNHALVKTGSPSIPLQSNPFPPAGASSAQHHPSSASDVEKKSQPFPQLWQGISSTNDSILSSENLKEWELAVQSGRINISSLYSKGLLNSLTQALQNSGVDLSQTNISVQIDIGKQANGRLKFSPPFTEDNEFLSCKQSRFRVASSEDPDGGVKRLKTGRS